MARDAPWLMLPAGFPALVALTDPLGALAWIRGEPLESLEMSAGPADYITGLFTRAGAIFLETHVWPTLRRESRVDEIYLPLRAKDGGELPCLVNARMMEGPNGPCCLWLFFPTHQRGRFERELIAARSSAQELAAQLATTVRQLGEANERLQSTAEAVAERNRELDYLAQTDALTGLGNRRALSAAFQTWRSEATDADERRNGALLMVDADHFKLINDRWGHETGDAVLVRLAATLRICVRRSDTVARLGGEEFALWLPDARRDVAERVAEGVHERLAQRALQENATPLTVSIGVALLHEQHDGSDLAGLLKHADEALYVAKSSGRNRTCWASPSD